MFRQATRNQIRLKMTIDGPAGSGKTYTALRFAHTLAQYRLSIGGAGKVAVIDTEHESASKYVGEAPDGYAWAFDTAVLTDFSPDRYTELIQMASRAGYSVLVIDSLSHAWEGSGGALELKDRAGAGGGNQYTAWRMVTPLHNHMIEAILQANCDVITTMRSRQDYVQETDDRGKVVAIRRVGMAPVQRPGMEFEFDIVADMDWDHVLTVGKTRCSAIDGLKVHKPGPAFMTPVINWLATGAMREMPVFAPTPPAPPVAPTPPPANTNAAGAALTLATLLEQYGAEAILYANRGQIPGTDVEVAAVAAQLQAQPAQPA